MIRRNNKKDNQSNKEDARIETDIFYADNKVSGIYLTIKGMGSWERGKTIEMIKELISGEMKELNGKEELYKNMEMCLVNKEDVEAVKQKIRMMEAQGYGEGAFLYRKCLEDLGLLEERQGRDENINNRNGTTKY